MSNSILTLAIIRANWEHNKSDYLETFVPLLGSLILKKDYSIIDIEVLRNDFQSEYGIMLPFNPLRQLLRRLTKKDYLKKNDDKLFPVKEKLSEIDFTKKAVRANREFKEVVTKFKMFIWDHHKLEFSSEDIENGFVNFLKRNDLSILFAAEAKSFLPSSRSPKQLDHLFAEFITYSHANDKATFQFILNSTIGYGLTSTILYSEFNSFSGNLKNVNIYLDTTFIFDLIGIDGELRQKLAKELVDILNNQKVNLFLLQTNQGEVESNLSECLKIMDGGAKDPNKVSNHTFRQCFRNNISVSEIEEIMIKFENFLGSHQIKPELIPDFNSTKEFQIDENRLYDTIVEVYAHTKAKVASAGNITDKELIERFERIERKNNTILRDVKALSSIYHFRRGRKPATIKDCPAIFMTTNNSLAFASRKFEIQQYQLNHTLPVCITDVFLGTLIWLQSPVQIEKLREKKLIVDCMAAMEPSERLIRKYLEEIEKLRKKGHIDSDIVYLMRAHRSAYNILESKTLGDPDVLDENLTRDIIADLINSFKEEESENLQREKLEHFKTKSELDAFQKRLMEMQQTERNIVNVKKQERYEGIKKKLQDLEHRIALISKLIQISDNSANRLTKVTVSVIVVTWILLLIAHVSCTIRFGWDVVEPYTYYGGLFAFLFTYVYFAITQRLWNPFATFSNFKQRLKHKYYVENGVDLQIYDSLNAEKEQIILEMDSLLEQQVLTQGKPSSDTYESHTFKAS